MALNWPHLAHSTRSTLPARLGHLPGHTMIGQPGRSRKLHLHMHLPVVMFLFLACFLPLTRVSAYLCHSNLQTTQVAAPAGTRVNQTPGSTQVAAPGTRVNATPGGAAVTAPGTTAVANSQGTAVSAPGTAVSTNNRNGATSVRAPGTSVNVAPGGATTVTAPFVGAIRVPGGRRMLRA